MDTLQTEKVIGYFLNSIIGKICIEAAGDCISHAYINNEQPQNIEIGSTAVLQEASEQLKAYFEGKLRIFTIPLRPVGTPYQQKIWTLLQEIPYGETATYKQIAARAGNPKASRAVGMANNRNPIPIFIPCHRVIGTDGSLTGFRGGLDMKRKLLEIEGYRF